MPLTPAETALVDRALSIIETFSPSTPPRITDHCVGSAVLCSDGTIYTGINVFHFAGGPCAENVALSNATAAGVPSAISPGFGSSPHATHIVAVRIPDRTVVNPCGRCRQMLMDYYPDISVIIKDGDELRTATVYELLPFAYTTRKL
ncbi:putative cytidine deaminase [Xylogone sp. PMI_703]|nr:putative cytidine deaminase [Xylogone sp. PMI_703]